MNIKNSADWEQHYLENDTPWDKGLPAPGLSAFLNEKQVLTGKILVPGCGLGHDVRALSAAGGDAAKVIGLDVSATAMSQASEITKIGREQFVRGDFFDLPAEMRGTFDWIWEHTFFCAIDQDLREEYVQASADALKPDGHLLAVFYLDPYDDEHHRGEGPPHGCSLEELELLFGPQFDIIEHWQPNEAYPGRENLELMVVLQKR